MNTSLVYFAFKEIKKRSSEISICNVLNFGQKPTR